METQEKTASELLAQIKKVCFKGVNLAKASVLEGEERRTFVLSQVERLLTPKKGYELPALWLSDEFWTADEGRMPMYGDDPLMTPQGLKTLTDKERGQLELIKEIAGLCHDLSLHFRFDLKEAFGFRSCRWWVSNKRLVEWLSTTPYEHIAMYVAYILKKRATQAYAHGHYQPAQDALAELFSSECLELVREPGSTKIPPRAYVKTIIDELQRIERHRLRGRSLGLVPQVVFLHDEIHGLVPRQFDKGVLQAAKELYKYMVKSVFGKLSMNPQSDVLERFAEEVRRVRSKYLAKGWVADGSLEFGYLLAHAEWCGNGWNGFVDEDL